MHPEPPKIQDACQLGCVKEEIIRQLQEEVQSLTASFRALKDVPSDLADIKAELKRLSEKFETGNITIEIMDRDIPATMKLKDVVQYLMRAPGATVKKREELFDRVVKVSKGIFIIVGAIITLSLAISKLYMLLKIQ